MRRSRASTCRRSSRSPRTPPAPHTPRASPRTRQSPRVSSSDPSAKPPCGRVGTVSESRRGRGRSPTRRAAGESARSTRCISAPSRSGTVRPLRCRTWSRIERCCASAPTRARWRAAPPRPPRARRTRSAQLAHAAAPKRLHRHRCSQAAARRERTSRAASNPHAAAGSLRPRRCRERLGGRRHHQPRTPRSQREAQASSCHRLP
mmetsp:Transcript_19094/g.63094  ORF Transcript_19094/g.63094 Transcript_19094/m.63094 type:complete len:205 (-) Transcript_19094:158-772(-)